MLKDYPRELVMQLKALESQGRASGEGPSPQEEELEGRLRRWPRTPKTDPYQAGLESLAAHLRPLLPGVFLGIAYLEFCAPTIEEAVEVLFSQGITERIVVPSMLTSGGVHSEVDIPAILDLLRGCYPAMEIRYACPFGQQVIAQMLVGHLERFFSPCEEAAL